MDQKSYITGLLLGSIAFVIWGLLPLYWRLVNALSPYQIFSHRVVWSLVFVTVLLLLKKEFWSWFDVFKNPSQWPRILFSTLFISINWLTFIWSVNNGYVVETSLGYYINPLVLTLFGTVIFKERLNRLQWTGILLASIGVLYKTLTYGSVPVIAFILAITFAIYGVLKKKSPHTAIKGLGFETFIVSIPAFFYLMTQESAGKGIIGNLPLSFWFLIALSGIATATPLLLYAESAKRLPLTVLGFLQYIAPTISLFLGVVVFKEHFDLNSLLAFSCIWLGLICFSVAQYRILTKKELKVVHTTIS